MPTPTRAPASTSGPASAATIPAERASWMPPAKTTCTPSSRPKASRVSTCDSHSTNDERGPTWPPHSKPSSTNRRAPSLRNRSSSPGAGTCR